MLGSGSIYDNIYSNAVLGVHLNQTNDTECHKIAWNYDIFQSFHCIVVVNKHNQFGT